MPVSLPMLVLGERLEYPLRFVRFPSRLKLSVASIGVARKGRPSCPFCKWKYTVSHTNGACRRGMQKRNLSVWGSLRLNGGRLRKKNRTFHDLPESTKTGDFNPPRTLRGSFFIIPERLASIRAIDLGFTANKQTL